MDKCKDNGDNIWKTVDIKGHKDLSTTRPLLQVTCNKLNQDIWVDLYAKCLDDPFRVITYAKRNNLLRNDNFSHLTKIRFGNLCSIINEVKKVIENPNPTRYKFSIEVPKGII